MSSSLIFDLSQPKRRGYLYPPSDVPSFGQLPKALRREEELGLPQVSELQVVRHFTHLASKSFGVDFGPYPLGSCTMKYNPKMHNTAANLPEFSSVHPLQDEQTVQGSLQLLYELTKSLCAVTGMKGGSLQPLAGAHGEYAGLKIIKAYHDSRNDSNRNTIIIPTSAHGTNPASATLTGFKVVEVATDERGLVDVESLKPLLNDSVAAIMLTNPNTLGLFEQEIKQIAEAAHQSGALLYYDGANLNAIMGICRPADMGFDVVHLNLHKTFSTPHGGGGPGAGPVLVADFLVPFLPVPTIIKEQERYRFVWDNPHSIGKVSCFWGNFLVLVKAYAYVLTMGADGLKEASSYAVLNANYMQAQLKEVFELPYDQLCMHEFVLSARAFKHQYGITAHDFAKALLDKGIHPPTVYFPLIVSEALMFEPTETEALEDLDAVIEAMKELARLAQTDPNKLKSAPHTTVVGRLDDAKAAKEPKLRYRG